MQTFYLVISMALVTFLIRYALLPLSGRIRFSAGMRQALNFVPPAVISAIVMPFALIPEGRQIDFSLANPYLVGAGLTVIIGWFSRHLLVTIVGGMLCFWTWRGLLTLGWV